jgi:hypothetical protein
MRKGLFAVVLAVLSCAEDPETIPVEEALARCELVKSYVCGRISSCKLGDPMACDQEFRAKIATCRDAAATATKETFDRCISELDVLPCEAGAGLPSSCKRLVGDHQ